LCIPEEPQLQLMLAGLMQWWLLLEWLLQGWLLHWVKLLQ
jgi:hypothetical protein